jgi:UDP-glucose 4-epimerase
MNTLITGGAGFIGSHLADSLLGRGYQVCVLDNLSSASEHNIEHLRATPGFRFVHGTVTDRALMERLVDAADTIYHLAAPVGVQLVTADPTKVIDTNVHGTEVVLQLAARGRKRVLLTSTSEVYGRRDRIPFREEDDLIIGPPDNGRWSYACSKLLDEFLALACWKQQRVPVIVTRLFNVVGPRQTARNGMVVPRLIEQALSGTTMTVFGDGSQRRCLTHVHDAVRGLVALAEHPEAVGQVYNVGSTNETAIIDLARRIKTLSGSRSDIEIMPYEQVAARGGEDMLRRVPDLTKIHRLTGYVAAHDIDAILRDTIAHHLAQHSRAASRAASVKGAPATRPAVPMSAPDVQC